MKPEEIINSTTPEIAKLIEAILQIEREYQYIQNIDKDKTLIKEIEDRIIKTISQVALK